MRETWTSFLNQLRAIRKWLTPGLKIKRWLLLLSFGLTVWAMGFALLISELYRGGNLPGIAYWITLGFLPWWARFTVGFAVGGIAILISVYELNRSILAPFTRRAAFIDLKYDHSRRKTGVRTVAIGGGTGLPSVLRGMKQSTRNITAIVTMADDGGSSGKLRRELGVLPPGDLRNNIAALASDEDLMTQLFQYRFAEGGLEGHSFGNLLLSALAEITGSMDRAVIEAARVLAIEGTVLPSTLEPNLMLEADVRTPDGVLHHVSGESNITETGGIIEHIQLSPAYSRAYPDAIRAILSAEVIVIGPGSLYTSIVPNLLVKGIHEALAATGAICVYVCNIAMQKGETDGFNAADHVSVLEKYIGVGILDVVLTNNTFPTTNQGVTRYVPTAPADHAVHRRYEVIETDLTDSERPWRHDSEKLHRAITDVLARRQSGVAKAAAAIRQVVG
jgi:uncharacterized cofD-like protein